MDDKEMPEWFREAISTRFEMCTREIDGCQVKYQKWAGSPTKPVLVLVHGLHAHGHWWDFVAPAFLPDYTVLAPHLSGMGDSGFRDAYSFEIFANEVIEIIRENVSDQAVYVAGHSLGGRVTLQVASQYAEEITGFVTVDPILTTDFMDRELRELETYATAEEAYDSFKLIPKQDCQNEFILRYLAERSAHQVEDGWTWKGDRELLLKLGADSHAPFDIAQAKGIVYGGDSRAFPKEMVEWVQSTVKDIELVKIEHAAHHLMLDQPQEFIQVLTRLLAK